jgi:imidazoleglycerol-phosphate dehydratase/histidinol-phosphatase
VANKILFVGWEGSLVEPPSSGCIDSLTKLRLLPDVIPALARFRAAGYEIVCAYNEPAESHSPEQRSACANVRQYVKEMLASQGVVLREILLCPHTVADDCACRKPATGLIAAYLPTLDRALSAAVGGKPEDVEFGRNIGIQALSLVAGPAGESGWLGVAHTLLDRPRRASVRRTTRETDIVVNIDLDDPASAHCRTGIGFFDHMLDQLGKHGGFKLDVTCRGDLEIDEHHTIEDVALTLGAAFKEALGDKRGIQRYGFVLPMDEASAQVSIDLGGRAFLVFEGEFPRPEVGGMPTELVEHFFRSFSDALGASLHIRVSGVNTHHMIEACFKCLARALRMAKQREGDDLPSTKGSL